MSRALEYHRATNVDAYGTDEDEGRTVETRPHPFKDYGGADRLPLEASVAGPLLQTGAGIVRSRETPFGPVHFRGYSSAGALYPIEAYVAAADGLYSFDALGRALVPVGSGDARARVAEAAAAGPDLAGAEAVIVLTGIHARTGWKYMERGYRHVWWDAGTMLANLLALAAADGLRPRLYTAFVDRELNEVVGVDGEREYALALLAIGSADIASADPRSDLTTGPPEEESSARFPLAERLHAASSLNDARAVREWRSGIAGEEPELPHDELERAIRRRGSVREYGGEPLPRHELADLLEWAEAPIPVDAPSVVRQVAAVASVDGLTPGVYDARLDLIDARDAEELRSAVGFAAMEQDHPRLAAANIFQVAALEDVVERLGDRGYRWAQLEAGIRAGRLQVGAFMRGWAAAASTFFDEEVSRVLATDESPMLMVAIGRR